MTAARPETIAAVLAATLYETAPLVAPEGLVADLGAFWRAHLPTEWQFEALGDAGTLALLEAAGPSRPAAPPGGRCPVAGGRHEPDTEHRTPVADLPVPPPYTDDAPLDDPAAADPGVWGRAVLACCHALLADQACADSDGGPPAPYAALRSLPAPLVAEAPPGASGFFRAAPLGMHRKDVTLTAEPGSEHERRQARARLLVQLQEDLETLRRLGASDPRAFLVSLSAVLTRVGARLPSRRSDCVSLATAARLAAALAGVLAVPAAGTPSWLVLRLRGLRAWMAEPAGLHAAELLAVRGLLAQALPEAAAGAVLDHLGQLPAGLVLAQGTRACLLVGSLQLGRVCARLTTIAQAWQRLHEGLTLHVGAADWHEAAAFDRAVARANAAAPLVPPVPDGEFFAPIGEGGETPVCPCCEREAAEVGPLVPGRDVQTGRAQRLPCARCRALVQFGAALPRARWIAECFAPAPDRDEPGALFPLGREFPWRLRPLAGEAPEGFSPSAPPAEQGWTLVRRLGDHRFLPADGQGPRAGYRPALWAGAQPPAGEGGIAACDALGRRLVQGTRRLGALRWSFGAVWDDAEPPAPAGWRLETLTRLAYWWAGALEARSHLRVPVAAHEEVVIGGWEALLRRAVHWYEDLARLGLPAAARRFAAGLEFVADEAPLGEVLAATRATLEHARFGRGLAGRPAPALAVLNRRVPLGDLAELETLRDLLLRAMGYQPDTLKARHLPQWSLLHDARRLAARAAAGEDDAPADEALRAARRRLLADCVQGAGPDFQRRRAGERLQKVLGAPAPAPRRAPRAARDRPGADAPDHRAEPAVESAPPPLPAVAERAWRQLPLAAEWARRLVRPALREDG